MLLSLEFNKYFFFSYVYNPKTQSTQNNNLSLQISKKWSNIERQDEEYINLNKVLDKMKVCLAFGIIIIFKILILFKF